jgi:hypothetical protein
MLERPIFDRQYAHHPPRTTGLEGPHTGHPKIDHSMLSAVPFCVLRRESILRWLGPGEAPHPRTADAGSDMVIAAAQGR